MVDVIDLQISNVANPRDAGCVRKDGVPLLAASRSTTYERSGPAEQIRSHLSLQHKLQVGQKDGPEDVIYVINASYEDSRT